MKAAVTLGLIGLMRSPGRTLTRMLVLAAAVGLLGAMLLFIGSSLRTMTGAAIRGVPLDWQGPVASYGAASNVAAGVAGQPGVRYATAAATAPFAGVSHAGAAGQSNAGSGSLLAVPPGYERKFHVYRFLQGDLEPGKIALDQQLAATLQARIGDTVTITPRPGARPESFTVSGVALITAPDVVFQPLNPQLGPAPAQPPANAAILPLDTFARTVAPELHDRWWHRSQRLVARDDRTLDLRLFAPEKGDWVDVQALSQGTLDLVYLAARLGLVRLVTGDRRPPLVFDDPFVTLDDARATRALDLLREISRDFQVIYLTTSDRYHAAADSVVELAGPTELDDGPRQAMTAGAAHG